MFLILKTVTDIFVNIIFEIMVICLNFLYVLKIIMCCSSSNPLFSFYLYLWLVLKFCIFLHKPKSSEQLKELSDYHIIVIKYILSIVIHNWCENQCLCSGEYKNWLNIFLYYFFVISLHLFIPFFFKCSFMN